LPEVEGVMRGIKPVIIAMWLVLGGAAAGAAMSLIM